MEIKDKKDVENLIVDHLSRIEQEKEESKKIPIDDAIPNEYLMVVDTSKTPWCTDFINLLAYGIFSTSKKNF